MHRTLQILIALVVLAGIGLSGAYLLAPVNLPLAGWLFGTRADFSQDADLRARVSLPPGYEINIYATGIEDARFMQVTQNGDLLVASRDAGELVLVKRDDDGDGRSDGTMVLASGLNSPHGLWLDGATLYVGEEHRISRFPFNAGNRSVGARSTALAGLPDDGGHHTRTVKKGPDGWIYVSIGSSCNVCVEQHPWRAAMIRFKPSEAEPEIYATGLRNTVGFDWQPGTGALFGADVGRDWLGDELPPEEVNLITPGGFYGWPYFNGDNVPDPDHGKDAQAQNLNPLPPVHVFRAHVTPLSITFLKHQAGTPLEGAALVAQHGSWNRSEKIGYRVVSLHWDTNGAITQKPFAEGFLRQGDVIGRPVDVVEAPDGTLYISDDHAGAIYRVSYTGN